MRYLAAPTKRISERTGSEQPITSALGSPGLPWASQNGREGMVDGLPVSAKQCKAAAEGACEDCTIDKLRRQPASPPASAGADVAAAAMNKPLALVHTDVFGPTPCESVGRARCIMTVLDDYAATGAVRACYA